jgi:hypothetical protein
MKDRARRANRALTIMNKNEICAYLNMNGFPKKSAQISAWRGNLALVIGQGGGDVWTATGEEAVFIGKSGGRAVRLANVDYACIPASAVGR